jgi:hypothetical protein
MTTWPINCWDQYKNNSTFLKLECRKQCPIECDQVGFDINRNDHKWDIPKTFLDYYKSILEDKVDIRELIDKQIKSRLTNVLIYFDKLETTEITQSLSYSKVDLMSSLGGIISKISFYIWNFLPCLY